MADALKLLPAVPTPEMDEAGKQALSDNGVCPIDDDDAIVCYRAMFNAAPRRHVAVTDEMVERAAKAAEYAETGVGYALTNEQFEVWWNKDPFFCKQVKEWASFTGTRKQKRIHETRIVLTAALSGDADE